MSNCKIEYRTDFMTSHVMKDLHFLHSKSGFNPWGNRKTSAQFENQASDVCRALHYVSKFSILLAGSDVMKNSTVVILNYLAKTDPSEIKRTYNIENSRLGFIILFTRYVL